MKLSFSTRGWDDISWDEMLDIAVDMHFDGIEVYNLHLTPELIQRGGPFHRYNTQATARVLHEKKLEIPVFDTSIDIAAEDGGVGNASRNAENRDDYIRLLKELIDAASNMSVRYVSVKAEYENEALVRENLDILLPYAEEKGIAILMKTCIQQ